MKAVRILLSAGAGIELVAPDECADLLDTSLSLTIRLREIAEALWDQGASRTIPKWLTALELTATYGYEQLTGDSFYHGRTVGHQR